MTKLKKNEPGSRAQKSSQRYHSNQPWGKKVEKVDGVWPSYCQDNKFSWKICYEMLWSPWNLLRRRVRFYLGVEVLAAAAQLFVELIWRLVEPALFVIYVLIYVYLCMHQQSVIFQYSKEYVVLIEIIHLFVQFLQKSHVQPILRLLYLSKYKSPWRRRCRWGRHRSWWTEREY